MAEVCAPVNLPKVKADFCAPDLNFGRIDKIYLGYDGHPFVDWEDLEEWTTRIDNTTLADLTLIRELHVIGDKPAAEKTKVDFSLGRATYTTPNHTVNIRVDETHEDNYLFLQWVEAHQGQTLRVWWAAGKYLYGGLTGVPATLVLNDVIPENDQELNTFQGTVTWKGLTPDRITNPMA